MAPALTEAGQSQNFKLSSNQSIPASPSKVDINGLEVKENETYLSLDSHLLIKSDGNIDNPCLNGASKILKEKPSFANLKPSRPRFVIPADSYAVTKSLEPSEGIVTSSDSGLVKNGGFMMSSDPSVGEHDSNMGLQKSNSGMMPTLGTGSYLKENFFPSMDMDQLFKTFSQSDLVPSGDIGHNMEEVLKLLNNSLENSPDLPEDLGGVDTMENGEPIFPMPEGADLSSLTTFEREILNEVDINMCVDNNLAEGNLPSKQILFDQKLEDVRKKQFEVERRCEFLLRRLRKLQAKGMGKHSSEEITGLLNYTQNLIQEVSSGGPVAEPNPKAQKRAISSMLLQLDTSAHSACAVKQPVSGKYFGSGSLDQVPGISSGFTLPKLSNETKEDIARVSGQLHTQLHMVESAVDSDVTASSSGGESCDEMVSYNNQHQQPLSITKRAAWKWAQERAGVASRWIWLQAHISDLEYRIRQHTEIHRQIRLTKGGVTLGGSPPSPTPPSSSNGSDPAALANGYKDPPECMGATGTCRTRPFVRTDYRKRKLLHTAGLHLLSKKAARSSTVRCGCRPPLASCALCTGRTDPTHPREQPDLLTVSERIALLDPSFHPVLSFPSDVSQSTHLDAIMRTPEWQHRMQRSGHKLMKHAGKIERDLIHQEERSKKHSEHRRKYTSRLKKNPANSLTASVQKIKKKLSRGRKPKGHHDADNLHRLKRKHKVKNNSMSLSGYEEDQNEELRVDVGSLAGGNTSQPSPAPSPCPFTTERSHNFVQERNETLRRKRENSYDIDNIVIPYSIASSTRVEKLQYKEILTPKWRIVEAEPTLDLKNNGIVRRSSHESDVEDVSDETIIQRHERCEVDEKKRFMAYVKNPNSGRPRLHRRTDSRAGSSGANTPDPMSPNNPAELGGDVAVPSPVTSPPATPLAAVAENETPLGAPPSGIPARRRTTSQMRLMRDEQRSSTPDAFDEVAPYEPRIFPLSDDEYERMLKCMPDGHQVAPFPARGPSNDTQDVNNSDNLNNYDMVDSLPGSPSTDTDSAVGEDPNDPEWTGESVKR